MTRRIEITRTGGPDVLRLTKVDLPPPGEDEVRVRVEAAGLNYIDIYKRTGLYAVDLPFIPGQEGAGTIEAVGTNVSGLRPGDPVVWLAAGSYSEAMNVKADRVVKRPEGLSAEIAAASFLKGLTADMLMNQIAGTRAGDTVLVHAAAGGVGLILTRWAASLGARVIGTAGSEAKIELARRAGADAVIAYRQEDIARRVAELTGGTGVAAVFDGVGKDTFTASLDSLRPRGWMISFGNASGPVAPFAPLELARRGSLKFTRPTLFDYVADAESLTAAARRLFDAISSGNVTVEIGQRFALEDVADAHRALEGRETTGSTVLLP